MKITLNSDIREFTGSKHFFPGRTGPDLWIGTGEVSVFWGIKPGQALKPRIDKIGTHVKLKIEDAGVLVFAAEFDLPPRREFARRFGAWPTKAPANWKETFGPANHWLPDAPASEDHGRTLPAIGPWRPWGPLGVDEVGGVGISHGWSSDDPIAAWDRHSGCMDRALVFYSAIDGEPLTPDQLGSRDFDGDISLGDNGMLIELAGLPRRDFLPGKYDASHGIRQFGAAIACNAQCPSPLVTRHIKAMAAFERLAFSEIGPLIWKDDYQSMNLTNLLDFTRKHPSVGIPGNIAGRTIGWRAWIMAMRLKVGGESPGDLDWCADFLELCERAAMPNGLIQRHHVDGDANRNGAWNSPGFDGCQVFEGFDLLACGVLALTKQLGFSQPSWIKRGIRQLEGNDAHWVDVAHQWPGAPLARVKAVGTEKNPAPWFRDVVKGLVIA